MSLSWWQLKPLEEASWERECPLQPQLSLQLLGKVVGKPAAHHSMYDLIFGTAVDL